MKKNIDLKAIILLITLGLISACGGAVENQIATDTAPALVATTSQTLSATNTSTATPEPTNTPTPAYTPTPDLPVSINAYFPQPLSPITTRNISQLELLGKLGEGELLDVIASEDETQIFAIYNTQVLTLDANILEIIGRFEVDIPIGISRAGYAISPDGKYFSHLEKTKILLYDLHLGEVILTFNRNLDSESRLYGTLNFTNKGKVLLYGRNECTAWHLPDGRKVLQDGWCSGYEYEPLTTPSDLLGIIYGDTLVFKSLDSGIVANQVTADGNIRNGYYVSNDESLVGLRTDTEITVWNLLTKDKVFGFPTKNYGAPNFSPDNKILYSYNSVDGPRVRFWRKEDGSEIITVNNVAPSVLFTPDSTRVILSQYLGGIQSILIYENEGGAFSRIAKIQYGNQTSSRLLMSSDGAYLIAWSRMHERIYIIDTHSGNIVHEIHEITDWDIRVTEQNKLIAKTNHITRVYDLDSGELAFEIPFFAIKIIPIGDKVLVTDEFATLSLFSFEDGKMMVSKSPVHPSKHYTLPENSHEIAEWNSILDEETSDLFYKLSRKPLEYYRLPLPSRNFSSEAHIYIRYIEDQIYVYEMDEYSALGFENATLLHEIDAPNIYLDMLRLTPDGKIIIAPDRNETLLFWSVETGKLVKEIDINNYIGDLIVSPQSDRFYVSVASGSYQNQLLVYLLPNLIFERSFIYTTKQFRPDGNWTSCTATPISLSPNGNYLLTVGEECHLQIIDTQTWHTIQTINYGVDSRIRAALSLNGEILAVAIDDTVVDFWDVSTGEIIHSIRIYESSYARIIAPPIRFGFSPDDRLFAVSQGNHGEEILLYGLWH